MQLAFNLRGRLASNIYKQPELRVLTLKTIPIWSPPVPSATSIFEYSELTKLYLHCLESRKDDLRLDLLQSIANGLLLRLS